MNKKYFIYARKSSEDKKKQIQSIDDQINVLSDLARQRGLDVFDVITDEKSAKQPGRTGFGDLIKRLQQGEAQGILCWKLDRLARNPVDGGSVTWLLQQGIIEEIITPDKTYFPTDNVILMGIEFGMANQYIIDLKKNVIRGMNSKLEKGWYPRLAPIGYLNEKTAEKGSKRIFEDPAIFPVLKKLWQKLLTGNYSIGSLYQFMENDCPIFVKGKLIHSSTFYRIFKNPFYSGVFNWNGKQYLGSHTLMITQKEFEKVQVLISAPTEIRETGVDYTFKGLFRCGVCGSMLTAEKHEKLIKTTGKRKNFIYYKCNHKKRDVPCSEKTIAEPKIVSQIADKITKLELPQEVIDLVLQEVGSIKEQQAVTVKSQQLQRALVDFDQRIKTLIDHIAEERDTDIRQYMKVKINKLKIAKREVEEELTRETNRRSPFAELKDNLEVIKHSQRLFHHGTKNDKMRVLKVLGSNWNIASDIVDYKANFEARAVEKAQNFYLGGLANYRTEDNGSYMPNKLVQDTADFLWSG